MTTVEHLLNETSGIWQQYYTHPFVKGIENGTLDKNKFRYYIIQDYLYLEDYAKAFAVGIAKAKSEKTTHIFSSYIALLTGSEMNIHHGYMGKFNVRQEEVDTARRALDNLSYTSYMLRVAYEESEVEILSAILSCAYSYELIAKNMIQNNPECIKHDFYGEWISGYASSGYSEGNKILIDTLNELASDYSEKQIAHLTDIFTACSRYELLFWDFSWSLRN